VRKFGWLMVLAVGMLVPAKAMRAQVAIYGEGTADFLNNGPYTDFLYGGTGGVLVDLGSWRNRITLSGDLQGDFVFDENPPLKYTGGNSPGESYLAVTVGPRVTFTPHFFKLAPYIQANAGFARYGDPLVHSATDSVIAGQAGVMRRISPRLDGVLDYSYTYYGYNAGYYSPQAFRIGVVYHFAKR
jgi:Outer membrane protein beta-barrel domain